MIVLNNIKRKKVFFLVKSIELIINKEVELIFIEQQKKKKKTKKNITANNIVPQKKKISLS